MQVEESYCFDILCKQIAEISIVYPKRAYSAVTVLHTTAAASRHNDGFLGNRKPGFGKFNPSFFHFLPILNFFDLHI